MAFTDEQRSKLLRQIGEEMMNEPSCRGCDTLRRHLADKAAAVKEAEAENKTLRTALESVVRDIAILLPSPGQLVLAEHVDDVAVLIKINDTAKQALEEK